MAFSREEVNFLIYRYLLETGLKHSAYTFSVESEIENSKIENNHVPPDALIAILQKGLENTELANEADGVGFRLIDAANYIVGPNHCTDHYVPTPPPSEAMQTAALSVELSAGKVTVLKAHQREVFVCAFNPRIDRLVSASADGKAMIYDLAEENQQPAEGVVLYHKVKRQGVEVQSLKDITTLDWNTDGTMVVTGSYDCYARVWTADGVLTHMLERHRGPVFAVRWNKAGNYILTASADFTIIVWNASTGTFRQQFRNHVSAALNIDWMDDETFASCSSDKMIFVCKVGVEAPLKVFREHTNEINFIKWDPQGYFLASCSDDKTIKIWTMDHNEHVREFKNHTSAVFNVTWSPTGAGTPFPLTNAVLASCSSDSTVRLWDVTLGVNLFVFNMHTMPVYAAAFSPDGKFLATGSYDKWIYVYNIANGLMVHSYLASGSILEICWNARGNKVAASGTDGSLFVLDLRRF